MSVGTRHEVASESGEQHLNDRDKFVKFYLQGEVVDEIVLKYLFSSLVKDNRRTCSNLRHYLSSTYDTRRKMAIL